MSLTTQNMSQESRSQAPKPHHFLIILALITSAIIGIAWKLFFTPPTGIAPLSELDLKQIQGPWFEVARLDSPLEQEIKYPMLFVKFTGAGADLTMPYPDEKDPRFRLVLTGYGKDGLSKSVLDEKTWATNQYRGGTLTFPCWHFLPCTVHVIDHDTENRYWMVVAGSSRNDLWIFARGPGLAPKVLENLKTGLKQKGYPVENLTYPISLPPVPDIVPAIPDKLPLPPGFKALPQP